MVGIAGDAKYVSLRDDDTATVYLPRRQQPVASWYSTLTFQVLPEDNAAVTYASIRSALEGRAPPARVSLRRLSDQLSASVARERLLALISGFFGGLTLFLAALGLHGVVSLDVSHRLRELGIRLALGADQRGLLALLLWQATRAVVVGLAVGGLGSVAAARLLRSLLYGLGP